MPLHALPRELVRTYVRACIVCPTGSFATAMRVRTGPAVVAVSVCTHVGVSTYDEPMSGIYGHACVRTYSYVRNPFGIGHAGHAPSKVVVPNQPGTVYLGGVTGAHHQVSPGLPSDGRKWLHPIRARVCKYVLKLVFVRTVAGVRSKVCKL